MLISGKVQPKTLQLTLPCCHLLHSLMEQIALGQCNAVGSCKLSRCHVPDISISLLICYGRVDNNNNTNNNTKAEEERALTVISMFSRNVSLTNELQFARCGWESTMTTVVQYNSEGFQAICSHISEHKVTQMNVGYLTRYGGGTGSRSSLCTY